jgi:Domain of unknown function (DUF4276)
MSDIPAGDNWVFYRFGLLVTGKGEEGFLPSFMRSLASVLGIAHSRSLEEFVSVLRLPRRRRGFGWPAAARAIPDRDTSEIGLPARNYLNRHPDSFVILVDDLEYGRRERYREIFERYRAALDNVLSEGCRQRVSVHFLVHMVEAYYFAHADAINAVLGTNLLDFEGDVENIRHPKGELKQVKPGFDELVDGRRIVEQLDLDKVLGNPDTCASLRTLFKWCWRAKGEDYSDRFQLRKGVCSPVTEQQVDALCQPIRPDL